MTLVLPLCLAACTPLPMADYASLRAGQRAASACQERLHEGAADFSECLRFVASHPPATETRREWFVLGALHYGWLVQDVLAQSGMDGADVEAKALVGETEQLRLTLAAPDAAMCRLVDIACPLQAKRRSELIAGR